ncbi:MAG: hypothetical protein M3O62_02710 [Pseudomonadota bacterium]|nr:hypothetical protein [Pseudomonadota bacterium]
MSSEESLPIPTPASPLSISLRDVTLRRHPGVRSHELKSPDDDVLHRICVAVPASYEAKTRRRYPLVVLFNACNVFGSAVEMSRLMAQTREIHECIVICLETPIEGDDGVQHRGGFIAQQLLPWCRENYRVVPGPGAVFSGTTGVADALACSVGADALRPLPGIGDLLNDSDPVSALVSGLRRHLGTGHQYGSELAVLSKPLVSGFLCALQPLFGLLSKSMNAARDGGQHVVRAQRMERDFEVFAILPASAATNPSRRYPALLVLDANIELSTAAEAAARLAHRGEIEEIVVIGIGIPRAEGPIEFGFRRFEEFSPPPDGYLFDDRLGRVFRALFATRGKDARQCVGKASQLHGFLVDELLPNPLPQLPIDESKLGLLGHSAGGAFVAYALCQERSPFRDYISISPGVGMSGSWLMREPQASPPLARAAGQIVFCVGGEEMANRFCEIAGIPATEALSRQVQQREPGLKVQFRCLDGETHSTIYAPAVTLALRSLYGTAPSRSEYSRSPTSLP